MPKPRCLSLLVPQYRQLLRQQSRRQPTRLFAHQDRLDDVRRKEREPQQSGGEGDIQPYLPCKVRDRLGILFIAKPPPAPCPVWQTLQPTEHSVIRSSHRE